MQRTTLALVLASLVSCASSDPPDPPVMPNGADSGAGNSADTGGASPSPAPAIGYDNNGCLNLVDHRDTTPIALQGKLVVTYYDETLEATLCGWDDESSTYWCPYPTQVSPQCEAYDGTYWCPEANPPASKLGDAQELGLLDLAHPELGVKRWTNNLVHEAELDISPDGTRVIYAVREYLDAFANGQGRGIWIVGSDGSGARQVTSGTAYAGIPTWVDDNRFTFVWDDPGAPASSWGLFLYDLTTSQVSAINISGFSGQPMDPEPSHDGKRVVFKIEDAGGIDYSVHVMQLDGTGVRRLTSGHSDHDPVFSRDDRKVYFERYYGPGQWDQYAELDRSEHPEINQWGIVEVDVATTQERVIIPHDPCGKHFVWLPTLSPDGQYLMFIHDYVDSSGGYQDLWVAKRDGGNAQRVPGTRGFYWFDWGQ